MPEIDLTNYSEDHATRLRWFADRVGETTPFPKPLPGGAFLSSKPKGIFKPQRWDHALSIRINIDSPYKDGEVFSREDGSWFFSYHQENPDSEQRDREFTNRALMRCIEDRTPVGVLHERVPDRTNRDKYDVLGLAVPTGWSDGYFAFEGVSRDLTWSSGDTITDAVIATAEDEATTEPVEPPGDDYDARVRVARDIVARRGQGKFRSELLSAYAGRCAITETDAEAVLEAAHIRPYRGPDSNVVTNGLLLRADIHTLFDLQLLAIHPEYRVVVTSSRLKHTSYSELDGRALKDPDRPASGPATSALVDAWKRYEEVESGRLAQSRDAADANRD